MVPKNRFFLLFAALAVSLVGAVPPASAQDNTIKQIAPDEALLDAGFAGRNLQQIEAGYVNNKVYVEAWLFDNSQLVYRKLSGRLYFTRGSFSEARTLERYCGEESKLNCRDVELKQHSKRFISMVYRNEDNSVCAALDYVGEDGRGAGRSARIFGNYIVSVVHCRHSGSDPEEVLANSAHYLATAKKDGRSIVNIGRFDLPKLIDPAAPAPSK